MTALSHTVALEAVSKHKSIDCGVALPAQNDLPLRTLCWQCDRDVHLFTFGKRKATFSESASYIMWLSLHPHVHLLASKHQPPHEALAYITCQNKSLFQISLLIVFQITREHNQSYINILLKSRLLFETENWVLIWNLTLSEAKADIDTTTV